jgi:hypothetical protein
MLQRNLVQYAVAMQRIDVEQQPAASQGMYPSTCLTMNATAVHPMLQAPLSSVAEAQQPPQQQHQQRHCHSCGC